VSDEETIKRLLWILADTIADVAVARVALEEGNHARAMELLDHALGAHNEVRRVLTGAAEILDRKDAPS
jgi:hypothetical protein